MGGYWDIWGNWINEPDDNTGYPQYPPPSLHSSSFPVYNITTDYSAATFNLLIEIKKMLQTLLERTK